MIERLSICTDRHSEVEMFHQNLTVSSRSSSSRDSRGSCGRAFLHSPRTSVNPLFNSQPTSPLEGQFTSFDASNFNFQHGIGERKKGFLRRYHSQESQHLTSSSDNTPDSTQDRMFSRSISDSGSSPENTGDRGHTEYSVRDFLERYSLPRVVRIQGGEPLLLYRCFDNFTKVQATPVWKKGRDKEGQVLQFPEGYLGWFSLLNEKGERSAVCHGSLLALVREQVCSFLSLSSFTAYTAHSPDPQDAMSRVQYLKTTVRGGQVFRLRAVFQHRERETVGRHSTRSISSTRSSRHKDIANRYAQLVDINNQELYAPLTTKGDFFEIYSSVKSRLCFPGMLDKTGPLALDKDCLYRLGHLIRRVALPLKVKLMVGPLPPGLPKDFPDIFTLEKKCQEPLLVTCTLPPSSDVTKQHEISCLNLNARVKISRSMLGFDSEYKLFKSQRLQMALSHCHKNIEHWYRHVRLVPNLKKLETKAEKLESQCAECRKNNRICLHKTGGDLEEVKRYTETSVGKQLITKEALEKFPKSKKWYQHLKIGSSGSDKYEKMLQNCKEVDAAEKIKSIDRYKDMSKLIEEKFGKKNYNPVKKSASFMFSTKRIDLEETPENKGNPSLLKCQSLDAQMHIEEPKILKKSTSNMSEEFQNCILENEMSPVSKTNLLKGQVHSLKDLRNISLVVTDINFDEIAPAEIPTNIPDLIPETNSNPRNENSFITQRLCAEFHVKTKIQKKTSSSRTKLLASSDNLESKELKKSSSTDFLHVVQVHTDVDKIEKVQKRSLPVVDVDLPYSQVADDIQNKVCRNSESENIYAEICDSYCNCKKMDKCTCGNRKKVEYCYVKLGSNGESVTQSSDDDLEAIYNTLR